MNNIKSRLSIILALFFLAGATALSSYSQTVTFKLGPVAPASTGKSQPPAADSYVDMGDPEDERFHNLQGWWKLNTGPAPPVNTGDLTSRYQTLRRENSVDLFVERAGVGYGLVFKTEDGGCDDSFEVYVNDSPEPLYTYRHGKAGNYYPLHYVNVDAGLITSQTVKVTFKNTAQDPCGHGAVYFVTLKDTAEQIRDLVAQIQSYELRPELSESLIVRLREALKASEAYDPTMVCEQMTAFMRDVEAKSGKELQMEQGMQLMTSALRIKAATGCQ